MEDGVWRTIGGRRVFIKNGENLEIAMKNSGKFPKRYTEKDITTLNEFNREEETRGYELNGIYLLKCNKYINGYCHKWVINETSDEVPDFLYKGTEWTPYHQDDKVKYFKTFKEGKEELIKLANKKK